MSVGTYVNMFIFEMFFKEHYKNSVLLNEKSQEKYFLLKP